jgi:hypothetical protein
MALPTRLLDTTQAHLEQLVAEAAPEHQHRDYKRELPTAWDDEAKKRFVADVVAMANAGGGDVIYGIAEDKDARAQSLEPQAFASVDVEVRRLQDFVMEYLEPRHMGVQVHPVPMTVSGASGHAIVIRVLQSWSGPHRSRLTRHFSLREGQRNRTLDVPEIRSLFLRSDSAAQKLRDFRSERLAKVVTGQTPVRLGSNPKFVIHAVPVQAAQGQAYIDPVVYSRGTRRLPVLGTLPASPVTPNFDGAFGPIVARDKPPGYTQQFRHGHFEAVWELDKFHDLPKPTLAGVMYEQYVNNFLGSVRAELAAHGLSEELAVFLSLAGADNAVLTAPSAMGLGYEVRGFDRKDILLPEAVIPVDTSIGRGMRTAYDLMCQAAGYEASPNYGEDGEWTAGRR